MLVLLSKQLTRVKPASAIRCAYAGYNSREALGGIGAKVEVTSKCDTVGER